MIDIARGKTEKMPRHAPNGYWLVDAATGERLERHRTRQAAIDNWRLRFAGRPIKIVRHYDSGDEVLVVEGTWHQSIANEAPLRGDDVRQRG